VAAAEATGRRALRRPASGRRHRRLQTHTTVASCGKPTPWPGSARWLRRGPCSLGWDRHASRLMLRLWLRRQGCQRRRRRAGRRRGSAPRRRWRPCRQRVAQTARLRSDPTSRALQRRQPPPEGGQVALQQALCSARAASTAAGSPTAAVCSPWQVCRRPGPGGTEPQLLRSGGQPSPSTGQLQGLTWTHHRPSRLRCAPTSAAADTPRGCPAILLRAHSPISGHSHPL
jgi:hypothetical protein